MEKTVVSGLIWSLAPTETSLITYSAVLQFGGRLVVWATSAAPAMTFKSWNIWELNSLD